MFLETSKRYRRNHLKAFAILFFGLIGFLGVGEIPASHADIALGQVDSFSVPGAAGWIEGGNSPNPPTQVSDPGSDGLSGSPTTPVRSRLEDPPSGK